MQRTVRDGPKRQQEQQICPFFHCALLFISSIGKLLGALRDISVRHLFFLWY